MSDKYTLEVEYQDWRRYPDKNPLGVYYQVHGIGMTPFRQHLGLSVAPENWNDKYKRVEGIKNEKGHNRRIEGKMSNYEALILRRVNAGLPLDGTELLGKKALLYSTYAREMKKNNFEGDIDKFQAFCKSIKNFPADPPMALVTNIILRKYWEFEIARGMGHNTTITTMANMKGVFMSAHKEKLIYENPFAYYTIPAVEHVDVDFCTQVEVDRLYAHMETFEADDRDKEHIAVASFLLGCYAGFRVSDWQQAISELPVRMYMGAKGNMLLNVTMKKTNRPAIVPVSPRLLNILNRLKSLPLIGNRGRWKEYLQRALKREEVNIGKDLTPHASRHTFGYRCAALGMSESEAAAIMGVATKTVKRYYHLTGHDITKQADLLGQL